MPYAPDPITHVFSLLAAAALGALAMLAMVGWRRS